MTVDAVVPPGAPPGGAAIRRAADATPFVRLVSHLLSLNLWSENGRAVLADFDGAVGVRSAGSPQKATVRAVDGGLGVEHGLTAATGAVVEIGPAGRARVFTATSAEHRDRAERTVRLLDPALPPWQDLALFFWSAVRELRGMPSLRLVDTGTGEEVSLGGTPDPYEIHGDAEALTRLLAGQEFFADTVFAGGFRILGTFSQFSVVCGASMRVMWDV
ncbi:hypothetical protein [Streptomyces sp. SID8352]|uniref:hypothetical protein n=1 Tax=Streptomyces sp. SID8352 TaxID=2690338 RepID=UPI00136FC522|nr:hypothetical protein [Streptomyces sp. SID8352]MYU22609.1 hypothetical protein [Streptomyces sp. SID8352]